MQTFEKSPISGLVTEQKYNQSALNISHYVKTREESA